ncbi:bifunctional adenosylcobinamide kinase/adenosylcobinamide-phosphate guanylyltransferase [Ruegeria lacuscaerulensis]|uniref:bifunctional adenosylcobinamide kinase/adenosylcobinamide-phosphate guanylyltransferase n=1 Tax=Ruegeria lacuscaerulensis TaxID=55218 RepID=UPI001BE47A6B|nr:bifunctional adenosylcobinamide kinase/adenosylcobinamide-phosphate guanylyltransferase [Ruegeria lacuscaerulensis]
MVDTQNETGWITWKVRIVYPDLTFVIGGAASGKSAFAEQLTVSTEKSRIYLATSQVFDDEMHKKVKRHVAQRGDGWTTIEAPLDLRPSLATLDKSQVCLIDCASMWLTNHLLADNDLDQAQADLLDALAGCRAPVIVVSNEVGQGIVPGNALSRRFREAQGRLNIALAAQADLVVQVTVGLPLVLKGQLP